MLNDQKKKKKKKVDFFGHDLTIVGWTKCRLVTFLSHSILFILFSYFSTTNTIYTSLSCPLLVYTFSGVIQFWRSIHLSFQSHQIRILSAGLGMARNRDGLSCNLNENTNMYIVYTLYKVGKVKLAIIEVGLEKRV